MAVDQHWKHRSSVVLATPTKIVYVPSRRKFSASVVPVAGTATVSYTAVPAEDVATTTLWTTTSINASAAAAQAYIDGPVTAIRCVVSGGSANTLFSIIA